MSEASTEFVRDLAGKVVAETYPGGWGPGYIYLNGEMVAQYRYGTTQFAHGDHLGSTRLLTTVSGGTQEVYDYLPFGEGASGTWSRTTKPWSEG